MAQTQHAKFVRGMDQERQPFTPSGSDLPSGDIVDLAPGLAATTGYAGVITDPEGLKDGVLGSVAITGVFSVRKLAVVFARGDMVSWDSTADGGLGAAVAAGGGQHFLGMCSDAAGAGDDSVNVLWNHARPV